MMSHTESSTADDFSSLLRRCSQPAQQAARRYRQTRQPSEVPTIVKGVISHYVEQDRLSLLEQPTDDLRLIEDLGLDSLSMIEISMTLEDAFEITLSENQLRKLETLGDVNNFAWSCLKS